MIVTLITGNAGKAKEFSELLGFPVDFEKLSLVEPQAISVSQVAQSKAAQAFGILNKPVLVDDSAIVIDEWKGLPGALTSWFMDTVGNEGILKMAQSLQSRSAYVVTALGYADSEGLTVVEGVVKGSIALEPRGNNGFGYDAIFIPTGQDMTFAEMDSFQKNAISMRRLATNNLTDILQKLTK
jgi:non-canonical purine NTP pyrophosphatase (RdgB/HAM1 family)